MFFVSPSNFAVVKILVKDRIHKYKIYSKGHLRRLARLESDAYSFSRILQGRQTLSCNNASTMNSLNIKSNEEIAAEMRNDNNVAYVSSDQKNTNDDDALQLNSIERDVLLPDSIEPSISTDISDIDDNFFDMSNNSLNEYADKNFNKSVAAWAIKYGITHSALIELLKILNTFTKNYVSEGSQNSFTNS